MTEKEKMLQETLGKLLTAIEARGGAGLPMAVYRLAYAAYGSSLELTGEQPWWEARDWENAFNKTEKNDWAPRERKFLMGAQGMARALLDIVATSGEKEQQAVAALKAAGVWIPRFSAANALSLGAQTDDAATNAAEFEKS